MQLWNTLMEVHSGRWSPTSAQDQSGGGEEEEQVVGKVEVNEENLGLGIMEWMRQAIAFVLGIVMLYMILVPQSVYNDSDVI